MTQKKIVGSLSDKCKFLIMALVVFSDIAFTGESITTIGKPVQVKYDLDFIPENGFVPTKEVAIKIAVAVWEPIYGVEQIAGERPYIARLMGDVWHVRGSLPPGHDGGVAMAEIAKLDGRIIRVIHEK